VTRIEMVFSMNRSAITAVLGYFGYSLVKQSRLETISQADFLRKLLRHLSVDCVFDVGANRGQYGRFLRNNVGFRGAIVSFEPLPQCLDRLRLEAKDDPRWLIEPYALGAQSGRAMFNEMALSVFSSFRQPDHSHLEDFEDKNRIVRQIEVDVATLDQVYQDVMARTGCTSSYLKLDTQGFDLAVAAGASSTIHAFRGLQTEASVIPIYEGMPDFSEALKSFQRLGFDISAIFPVNPRDNFPRMLEFDCHMVNRNCLSPR